MTVKKPKPPMWSACESCPIGAVLRTEDGQLVDCYCLAEKRRVRQ